MAFSPTDGRIAARLDSGDVILLDPKNGDVKRGSCKNAKTYKVREVGDDCEIWL